MAARKEPDSSQVLLRALTIVSTVVGLVVTAITVTNTLAEREINREKSFRESVRAEEVFWRGLSNRYYELVSNQEISASQKSGELLSIAILTDRKIGKFAELDVDDAEDRLKHVKALRLNLRQSLQGWAESNPSLGEDILLRLYEQETLEERKTNAPEQANIPPSVTDEQFKANEFAVITQSRSELVQQAEGQDASPRIGTRVLTAGVQAGWAIDVFWCNSSGSSFSSAARRNFAVADSIGENLAEYGKNGDDLDGLPIGRVRVRSLSIAAQNTGRYATKGQKVIYDLNDQLEEDAARKIKDSLVQADFQGLEVGSSRSITKWYISIFICQS